MNSSTLGPDTVQRLPISTGPEKNIYCNRILKFLLTFFVVFGLILPETILAQGGPNKTPTGKIEKLEQSANGKMGSETSPTSWVTGIVNKAKAHFLEDMCIPYRLTVSSLIPMATPGTPTQGDVIYTITLGFDTQKDGLHAIDYLTSFDYVGTHSLYTAPHPIEEINPLQGTGVVDNSPEYLPIPTPASEVSSLGTYGDLNPDGSENRLTIYNGEFVSATYTKQDPLLPGATTSSDLEVKFRAHSDKVVIAWGGHIALASENDWPEGFSASAINGAPYHMFISSCDEALLDGCGNKEVQLHADAVDSPPKCTISGEYSVCQEAQSLSYTADVENATSSTVYSWEIEIVQTSTGTDPTIDEGTEDDPVADVTIPVDFYGSYTMKLTVSNDGILSLTGTCEFTTVVYDNPDLEVQDLAECESQDSNGADLSYYIFDVMGGIKSSDN
ncbi:hypothetical protein ACXYMT_15145, partial [Salinimicrobium sp. CAU 1759]